MKNFENASSLESVRRPNPSEENTPNSLTISPQLNSSNSIQNAHLNAESIEDQSKKKPPNDFLKLQVDGFIYTYKGSFSP